MNAKKHRRKAPKLTQKLDRGSQHRKTVEGKSNIVAKRVTLLPGFLINGFTSNTVKKTKTLEESRKKKNLLNEDLQGYLEQKGKHPRRSQRILKKHFDQYSVAPGSKSSNSNHCNNLVPSPGNIPPQKINNIRTNISFKSILKNSSKSIFKDISERLLKVNIQHNSQTVSQKPISTKEHQNVNQNFDYPEDVGNEMYQNNPNLHHFQEILPPENLDLNGSFCKDLERKICVTFKRKAVDECKEKAKKYIKIVNMVLEGKVRMEEMNVPNLEENQSGEEPQDGPAPKFYPIPSQNWVYSTPPNQKIGIPQIEDCQLQAGILCHNKNQQNLYEVRPDLKVNFSKLRHVEDVSIDDRFLKRVAQVKKTPANFGFRGYKEKDAQHGVQHYWRDSAECGGSTGFGRKESFVNPNYVNIITRPTKIPRKSVFTEYLQDNMPTPKLQEKRNENFDKLQDVTFIEDGDDFMMQEIQPTTEPIRNKRKMTHEDVVIKQRIRNIFTEPSNCDNDKIFNFGSQERNMFNFGKL